MAEKTPKNAYRLHDDQNTPSDSEKIQYPQVFLDFLKHASNNPDRYMKDLEIIDRNDVLPYERDIF